MVKAGKIRQPNLLLPIESSEVPYGLPFGWKWIRAVDLIHTVNGRVFKPTEWTPMGLPIIRIQNLNRADAPFNRFEGEVDQKFLVEPGDLLISWSGTPGTSFGAFVWSGPAGILNQHIFKCHLYGDYRDYLCLAVNSRLDVLINDAHGGVGLRHFTKGKLERLPLPVPPLAEQQRIVDRVDELMTLCDEIEVGQARAAELRSATARSTVASIVDLGPGDTDQAVRLVNEHLRLCLTPGEGALEVVVEVRQAILDLAVRGRLVPQNPGDEPALALLTRITEARQRVVVNPRGRKTEVLVAPPLPAAPYELPAGWSWTRLREVALSSDSGWSPRCRPIPARAGEWGVLKTSAVTGGVYRGQENKVLDHDLEPRKQHEVQMGDLVVCRASGSRALVGRSAIVDAAPRHLMLSDKLVRFRFMSAVTTRYMQLVNSCTHTRAMYEMSASGTSTMSNITREQFGSLAVPLPPLAEQRRIVDRVDELMTLCDEIEAALGTERRIAADFAESALAAVVG